MLAALVLFTCWFNDPEFILQDTGIYFLVPSALVQINGDRVFVIDRSNTSGFIKGYDLKTQKQFVFGPKGQGPGSLLGPDQLRIANDQLMVSDLDSVDRFTLAGEHVSSVRAPYSGLYHMMPCLGGWIGHDHFLHLTEADRIQVKLYDENLKERTVLLELPFSVEKVKANDRDVAQFGNMPMLTVSSDGRWAYMRDWQDFKIYIFDIEKAAVVKVIEEDRPKLRPPDVWIERQLEILNKRSERFFKENVTHWPAVKHLGAYGKDRFIIVTPQLKPPFYQLEAFDNQGNQLKPPVTQEADLMRLVDWNDQEVIVTTYENEEFGLARVPLDVLPVFLEDFPVDFREIYVPRQVPKAD